MRGRLIVTCMGNVVPFRPLSNPDPRGPVTEIGGAPVRTYRVLIRNPATGGQRHENWVALEDLSEVEMCQDALNWATADFGTPEEMAGVRGRHRARRAVAAATSASRMD